MVHDGFFDTTMIQILAISGSLRESSINSALLRAAARLAPPGAVIRLCDMPGKLPLFNPDLENALPDVVVQFRREVAEAGALLIASPEYAHGVTGVMKNALDWLVGDPLFVDRTVAVLNAAPRAHHADDALRETLRTMSARIVEEASLAVPGLGKHASENEMMESAPVVEVLRTALAALCRACG
jgi:chromate reductase